MKRKRGFQLSRCGARVRNMQIAKSQTPDYVFEPMKRIKRHMWMEKRAALTLRGTIQGVSYKCSSNQLNMAPRWQQGSLWYSILPCFGTSFARDHETLREPSERQLLALSIMQRSGPTSQLAKDVRDCLRWQKIGLICLIEALR